MTINGFKVDPTRSSFALLCPCPYVLLQPFPFSHVLETLLFCWCQARSCPGWPHVQLCCAGDSSYLVLCMEPCGASWTAPLLLPGYFCTQILTVHLMKFHRYAMTLLVEATLLHQWIVTTLYITASTLWVGRGHNVQITVGVSATQQI